MIDKKSEENLRTAVRFAFKNLDFKHDPINRVRRARNIVDDEMNKIFWEIQNGNFKED